MAKGIKKYYLRLKNDQRIYYKSICEGKIVLKEVGFSDWLKGFATYNEAFEFLNKSKLNDRFIIQEIELRYFL